MKAIIIYQGKYGATKQYALWLGRELSLPVRNATYISREQLDHYDTLLIGTSVYIGQLQVKKWLKKNLDFIRNKKIILFQVAGTAPEEKEKRQAYNLAGIPAEIMSNCECYFLPGRMILKDLSWKDRFMLKIGARLAKSKDDKKIMLTDYDHVKKENLSEMLKGIRNSFSFKTSARHEKETIHQF
ncbi:MAG: flavodoxin domain-containing protein [Chitinophagaceae bacterium]